MSENRRGDFLDSHCIHVVVTDFLVATDLQTQHTTIVCSRAIRCM